MDRKCIIPSLRLLRMLITIMLAYFATISNATEADMSCLRSIKESLEDPLGALANWDFNYMSGAGSVCEFKGVKCWQQGTTTTTNIVFSIELPNKKLRGSLPIGIRNCNSITKLDLSSNYISGPIPSNLGDGLAYIVDLNLSNNSLSGPIPRSFVNWRYINFLRLDNNHLTGQIPSDLAGLERIKIFNVTNNRLSGAVPMFPNSNFTAESYANNKGLCGGPLKACNDDDGHDDLFLPGFAVGFSLFTILSMLFMFYFFSVD